MILVSLLFGFMYCRTIGPYWKLVPDSTTYVLGAKSLAEGQGYREQGKPVVLFAPGTSLLLTPAWILGGGSYLLMNAEVVLFAFAALAACFFLFRQSLGTLGSGTVMLLCLGSAEYFERSTFLLSEIFYIFFSLAAFSWYRRGNAPGTIFSSLAGLMVRTVGFCLPVAFALDTILFDPFRKGPKKWLFAAAYASPLLFSAGWEFRNRVEGWSYTELMIESDPWNRAGGHIPALKLLIRLWDNLAYGRAIEDLLTNQLTRDAVWPGVILAVLIGIGFRRLSRSGWSAAGIYSILFLLTVALYWPEVVIRLATPLLPFLMAYLVAGLESVAKKPATRWLLAPAAWCLALYLVSGYRSDLALIASDRAARIPDLPVIYPGHEDMERLAVWWKEHAGNRELYACQHPNVLNVVTGRDGVLYENSGQPGGLERAMQARHARFLLLDLTSGSDSIADRGAARGGQLRLLREQGVARLYELSGQ
jgi:hypothetical protein